MTPIVEGMRVRYDDTSAGYDEGSDIFEGEIVKSACGWAILVTKIIKQSNYTRNIRDQSLPWEIGNSNILEQCSYVTFVADPTPISAMLPTDTRIVYDDKAGNWRVMFAGKLVRQVFKTNSEAYSHLQALKEKRIQPEY